MVQFTTHPSLFKATINKNNLCSKIRKSRNLLEIDEKILRRIMIISFDLGRKLKHPKQSLFTISKTNQVWAHCSL